MSNEEKKSKLIRFGVTRNYGAHSVYFEVSEQIEISSFAEQEDALDTLINQANHHVSRYEEFFLPHVKMPQGFAGSAVTSTPTLDTVKLDKIIVENVDGKRRVKAVGGKYEKFGVPCYKECQSSIELDSLEYGKHDYSHLDLKVVIELEGGKPKRVRSISA